MKATLSELSQECPKYKSKEIQALEFHTFLRRIPSIRQTAVQPNLCATFPSSHSPPPSREQATFAWADWKTTTRYQSRLCAFIKRSIAQAIEWDYIELLAWKPSISHSLAGELIPWKGEYFFGAFCLKVCSCFRRRMDKLSVNGAFHGAASLGACMISLRFLHCRGLV